MKIHTFFETHLRDKLFTSPGCKTELLILMSTINYCDKNIILNQESCGGRVLSKILLSFVY